MKNVVFSVAKILILSSVFKKNDSLTISSSFDNMPLHNKQRLRESY